LLRVTTFWSFVREFPRGGLNWAPVRPVSRGHASQTGDCSAWIGGLATTRAASITT